MNTAGEYPMNIFWFTVRKIGDLCSTTTIALANGLVEEGHSLTLLGPKSPSKPSQNSWMHVDLNQSSIRGLKASSLARKAVKWLKENRSLRMDAVIIDWQIAPKLAPLIMSFGHPIIIMDRSPPADASILAKLQWRVWKKAWKLVENQPVLHGCVVSEHHSAFVRERFNVRPSQIHVLPAGVDLNLFTPKNQEIRSGSWRFIYHGRLDKNRGVFSLPMLIQKLNSNGVASKLTLVGEGDAFAALENLAESFEWMDVYPKMDHAKIAGLLSKHHIGLLPMPESKVWKIASPLKRSEYLASGLLVLGTRHNGHEVSKSNSEWMKLFPQEEFHRRSVEWLTEFDFEDFSSLSKEARLYAEEHYSWDKTVRQLIVAIHESIKET